MRDERTPKDVCGEAKDNYDDKILSILTSAHASTSVILADKRGSRRHFFPSFSENIAVAKTSYKVLEILSFYH